MKKDFIFTFVITFVKKGINNLPSTIINFNKNVFEKRFAGTQKKHHQRSIHKGFERKEKWRKNSHEGFDSTISPPSSPLLSIYALSFFFTISYVLFAKFPIEYSKFPIEYPKYSIQYETLTKEN